MHTSPTVRFILVLTLALVTASDAFAQAGQPVAARPPALRGRAAVSDKLNHIRLDTVAYDGLPLLEVVKLLRDESLKRDPEKKGINFVINRSPPAPTDPRDATGTEPVDINSIAIRIYPALSDLSLLDTLDAVVKVAERPIKYSIEDYGVIVSLCEVEPAHRERGFDFPGGNPIDFLKAVQDQHKVDWSSVADIPQELRDVRIPKLRIYSESLAAVAGREGNPGGPLGALVSLYNQLAEQKPELGRLVVKGDLAKPSVVLFVPDARVSDGKFKMKVKAFSVFGINEAGRKLLQEDIERARDVASVYAERTHDSSGQAALRGIATLHNETSLLVATGPEAFVDMVESIVSAWQAKERAQNTNAPTAPASTPAR